MLGEQHGAAKPHVQLPLELLQRHVEQAFANLQHRAVDQDIDRTKCGLHLRDRRANLLLARNVACCPGRFSAALADGQCTRMRIIRPQVGANQLCTFVGEAVGDATVDIRSTPCD
jgi:hypothetical protein